jgi:cystathionine beta-lyase/cystathionine gamma-synthase
MGRGIGTRAVHGARGAAAGPLATPIVQSSTFVFESAAQLRRHLDGDEELFFYTRYGNPTVRALEEALAALEQAEAGLALASGMAAVSTALLSLVQAGDEVLASASLYGGTGRLLAEVLPRLGITTRTIAPADLPRLGEAASPRARAVILESPTNPGVEVVDIAAVCAAAHARGLAVIVDNTFATPVLQQPLRLGADLVMHSVTKALAGHSDLVGGALVGSRARIEAARALVKVLGGCMDPHAAFLALRGIKTVHLRVQRQCENAQALASHLAAHPKVARVAYPGLPSHPAHEVARRQMSAFGGMVAFSLHGGLSAAERFYDALELIARAVSLGGVETLVSLPVLGSHHMASDRQRAAAGVDPGTVRLSLGIEDAADLIADVDRALSKV